MSSEETPTDPVPPLLTDAVLHDRRDSLRVIFAASGGDYEKQVAPLREKIRSATLDGGTIRDAHARLVADLEKKKGWKNIDNLEWAAALLDCLEAGEVPTEEKLQAAEAAAPVKGKKERKSKGPRKVKAPTVSWAQKIGKKGTRLKLPGVKTFEEVQAWLQGSGFKERPIVSERNTGKCTIDYSGGVDFTDFSLWKFGGYAVYGWRVDKRKVPSGTLARMVEEKIREEEKLRDGKKVGKAERKAIKGEIRQALLSKALVETQVYSVLLAPTEGWALVDGPPQVVEEVRIQFGAVVWPLTDSIAPVIRARLAAATGERFKTDLRQPHHDHAPEQGEEKGDIPADILSNFLLYLATPGTAQRHFGPGWKNTWKLAGGPIKLRVPVGDTFNEIELEDADSAALVASLAEGGRLQAVRIAIEDQQESAVAEEGQAPAVLVHTYGFSLEVIQGSKTRKSGLRIHTMNLPTLKGGDNAEALVFERVALHKRLWDMMECLFRAYASDRCQDWQPTIDAAREWVGLELARRFTFDAVTGQGWLFAPPAQQVLQIEEKNAEAPKKSRKRG